MIHFNFNKKTAKKIGAILLASTMALSMLVGCGGGSGKEDAKASDNSTLKFGCYIYANNFDPAIDQNSAWGCTRLGIGECLFKFDSEVVAQPNICDKIVSESEDGLEYVLHIRDGVKFSNGNPCDAQAVADSLTRLYNVTNSDNEYYGTTATSYVDLASAVANKEDNTVTLTLNTRNPYLEGALCFPFYAIIDVQGDVTDEGHKGDAAANQAAGYAPTEVVGTGPYVLTDFDETTSCGKMVANEYYWKEEVPYKAVEFTHIAEPDKKAMALKKGEIDLTENVTTSKDLDDLKSDDKYYVSQATGVRSGIAYVNFDKILKNDTLREAVMMAIDGKTMCDVTVGGMYTYGPAVLPSSLSYDYDKLNYKYGFDKDGAIKMLDDAGIVDTDGDGIRELDGKNIVLEFKTYVNRCLDDFAQACQTSLTDVGIGCNVTVVDDQVLWDEIEAGNWDLCNCNWTTVGVGDPTGYMKNWLGGDSANYCNYNSEKYNELFAKFEKSTDDKERADLVIEMEQVLLDDTAVLVHGYYNSSMISNAEKVKGADIATIDYYWLSTDIKPAQ